MLKPYMLKPYMTEPYMPKPYMLKPYMLKPYMQHFACHIMQTFYRLLQHASDRDDFRRVHVTDSNPGLCVPRIYNRAVSHVDSHMAAVHDQVARLGVRIAYAVSGTFHCPSRPRQGYAKFPIHRLHEP